MSKVKITFEIVEAAVEVLRLAAAEEDEDLGEYIAKAALQRAMGQLQPGDLSKDQKNALRGRLIRAINEALEGTEDDTN